MAQGSVIWRCRQCGNRSVGTCPHPRAGYSIVCRVGGRQKWEAVGRNKKAAEKRLVGVLAQLHAGTFREPTKIFFRDFAERWLVQYVEGAVKPSTLRTYRWLLSKHLVPAFGSSKLTDLTAEHVQRFTAEKLKSGLSPKTVRHLLVVLKHMLKHAKKWGYLRYNPADDVEAPRVESREMDALTPEELRRLFQAADEPYRTLFLCAALTGMRRGELLGLRWGDVDWHQGRIYVHQTLFKRTRQEAGQGTPWLFQTPKSRASRRAIVMSPALKEALEFHRLTCPASPHDLVFCKSNGAPMDAELMVRREFQPALTRAGLRHIRFHDLRHTYASLLIAQGAHVRFIQDQLGHSSVTTSLNTYGHLLPGSQPDVGVKLDQQVFGASLARDRANMVLTERPELRPIALNQDEDDMAVTLSGIDG